MRYTILVTVETKESKQDHAFEFVENAIDRAISATESTRVREVHIATPDGTRASQMDVFYTEAAEGTRS